MYSAIFPFQVGFVCLRGTATATASLPWPVVQQKEAQMLEGPLEELRGNRSAKGRGDSKKEHVEGEPPYGEMSGSCQAHACWQGGYAYNNDRCR